MNARPIKPDWLAGAVLLFDQAKRCTRPWDSFWAEAAADVATNGARAA